MRLPQQNVSYSRDEKELDIRSSSLVPLITYPHFSESEYNDRISEMESLGITSIILGGKTIVNARRSKMCAVIKGVLEQCFSLDAASLDHGELSRLARHVIVSDCPYIIDFESASTIRRTSNVTAAAQSIFLYGILANGVRNIFGNIDKERLVHTLRTYKHFQTRANFDTVLDSLPV
jgi:predicted Ser/Thr protein kinase